MANNLVLGRGKVYFDRFIADTETKTGERYFGSTPSFAVSVETQELDHFSSEEGLRIKDESVTTQIDYSGQFTTDNVDFENLALFFLGSASTLSQGSGTAIVEPDFVAKQGHYYQLGATPSKPEGVEKIASVAVRGDGATPTYVVNDDYTVDTDLGRIYIVPGGGIADNTILEVTYNRTAATQSRVVSGSSLLQGALRFISFNGVGGQKNFYMPKVTLRPNGELALKGEEWQQFSFNVEILKAGTLANLFVSGRAVV